MEDKTIKQLMLYNSDMSDFVDIEDGSIAESDQQELILDVTDGEKPKHVDLVKLAYLYIQGYSPSDMGKAFNVDPQHINKIKRSAKFKTILTTLNGEIINTARTFLNASGMKAVFTLLKCMDSADDRTKLKASTEVLDRIGIKTPEQFEIINKNDHFNGMDEDQLLELVNKGLGEITKSPSRGVIDGKSQYAIGEAGESEA